MPTSQELPDCIYSDQPVLVTPNSATPNHSLSLSNLDGQKFLRFSIKYLYLFKRAAGIEALKLSLSRALVHYYPLAGRLRADGDDDHKLRVECNGEGAVFSQAFMDVTADDFLRLSHKPHRTWRKLLFKVEAPSFLDVPPLIVQVTSLRCGGMILCTAINHCLCDGIGTSLFLSSWAHLTTHPNADLPTNPFHSRLVFKPRQPGQQPPYAHPALTKAAPDAANSLFGYLKSQPLVPASLTFTPSRVLHLKRQCEPSLKCTAFEVLASHTWRSWVRSLDLPPSLGVKLLFTANVRSRVEPEIPEGYYGNGFVLACAEARVWEVAGANLRGGVRMVQLAKSSLTSDYVKSVVEALGDETVAVDTCTSLVISQWSKLGLENLDFGEGKPLHMGSLTSDIYCLFLPVAGDLDSVRVLVSMPESVVDKFEYYMTDYNETDVSVEANHYLED